MVGGSGASRTDSQSPADSDERLKEKQRRGSRDVGERGDQHADELGSHLHAHRHGDGLLDPRFGNACQRAVAGGDREGAERAHRERIDDQRAVAEIVGEKDEGEEKGWQRRQQMNANEDAPRVAVIGERAASSMKSTAGIISDICAMPTRAGGSCSTSVTRVGKMTNWMPRLMNQLACPPR